MFIRCQFRTTTLFKSCFWALGPALGAWDLVAEQDGRGSCLLGAPKQVTEGQSSEGWWQILSRSAMLSSKAVGSLGRLRQAWVWGFL